LGPGEPPGVTVESRAGAPTGLLGRLRRQGGARGSDAGGYGRGARILSVGIATTGLVTFAYFSVASHVLPEVDYKRISLLWSVMFVIVSIIYRPIEQLLSRTIADRRARGLEGNSLRVPMLIQLGFALTFLAVALGLRGTIEDDVFDGSTALYWILVIGVLAYAASYFARGWLAGHQRFGLYGGLVLLESTSRFLFALAVAVGIASGQTAVAMGIAAAPFVSLVVVPAAFARRGRAEEGEVEQPATKGRNAGPLVAELDAAQQGPGAEAAEERAVELSLRHGSRFAVAVLAIMLAEQTLLNAAVITVDATAADAALAGFVFNVLLIARAPLQLFQSIQTSLLPHLAGLEATRGSEGFDRAVRVTVLAIAAFAGAVALGLLAIGPFAMSVLFGGNFDYSRGGLALVALGMGFHLTAGTLNQAALARGRAGLSAVAWMLAGLAFVGWMILPTVSDQVLRAEIGYFGAAGILAGLLYGLYRRPATGGRRAEDEHDAAGGRGERGL
jgi:O-antigen/teichoic acid export membrane protein